MNHLAVGCAQEHNPSQPDAWPFAGEARSLPPLAPEVGQQVNDLLTEAGGLASLFLRTDSSPWTDPTPKN